VVVPTTPHIVSSWAKIYGNNETSPSGSTEGRAPIIHIEARAPGQTLDGSEGLPGGMSPKVDPKDDDRGHKRKAEGQLELPAAGSREVVCLEEEEKWVKVALLGNNLLSLKAMWQKFENMFYEPMLNVRNLSRFDSNGGGYTIEVCSVRFERIMSDLARIGRDCGLEVCFGKKRDSGRAKAKPVDLLAKTTKATNLLCSWNINGWRSKRVEVEYALRREKPLFLAVQETNLSTEDFVPRVTGYKIIHEPKNSINEATRGNMLCIRRDIPSTSVEGVQGFLTAAKAFGIRSYGSEKSATWTVGSVYLPGRKRLTSYREVRQDLARWMRKRRPLDPVILGGDWNMEPDKLHKWLVKNKLSGWCVFPVAGDDKTWHSPMTGRKFSAIDHVVGTVEALRRCTPVHVDRTWDLSDHWKISCSHRAMVQEIDRMETKPKFDRNGVVKKATEIFGSTYWDVLADMPENNETIISTFIGTANRVAKNLGLVQSRQRHTERSKHIPPELKRAFEQRRRAYGEYLTCYDPQEKRGQWDYYLFLKKEAKTALREFNRNNFTAWVQAGCERVRSHDSKGTWQWINQTSGKSSREAGHGLAIKSKAGKLLCGAKKVTAAWKEHFEGLAADVTGHSMSKSFWETRLADLEEKPEWDDLNDDLTFSEVGEVVRSLQNGKATGDDSIPGEFYKAMLGEDTGIPTSSASKTLFRIIEQVWLQGVPEVWQRASIISIPKKGDLTDTNNYRGISLINLGVKIAAKIMANRISRLAEKNGNLCPEQFGFRKKEECVALYATLLDTCQRRSNDGKPTFVAFLDIQKAYDTVPIWALLTKLSKLGIRGHALRFIENLYLTSKANVRCGENETETFEILRGVRQGCPLSPILFNLFINELMAGSEDTGVDIIGTGGKLGGGLFADDAAGLAESAEMLQAFCHKASAWAGRFEMNFGIKKCGVMVVGPSQGVPDPTIYLQGEILPVVDEYRYLGIMFTKDLSLARHVRSKSTGVRLATLRYLPFLRNHAIPVAFRLNFLKCVIVSAALHGAELLGNNIAQLNDLQRAVNHAMKIVAGVKGTSPSICADALSREFNIPPVAASCILRRMKAWRKWITLPTKVHEIIQEQAVNKKDTWAKRTRTIFNKLQMQGCSLSEMKEKVHKHYWEGRHSTTKRMKEYTKFNMATSSEYLRGCYSSTNQRANTWLIRARCGYLPDFARAVAAGFLPKHFGGMCLSCGEEGAADFGHILLECPLFDNLRVETGLQKVINFLRIRVMDEESVESYSTVIIAGLFGGSLSGDQDFALEWAESKPQSGNRLVGEFLRISIPRLQQCIRETVQSSRTQVRDSFQSSRSPTGMAVRDTARAFNVHGGVLVD
jgi:hypothetical protein